MMQPLSLRRTWVSQRISAETFALNEKKWGLVVKLPSLLSAKAPFPARKYSIVIFSTKKIFLKIVPPPLPKKIQEAIAPVTAISFDRRADWPGPNAKIWMLQYEMKVPTAFIYYLMFHVIQLSACHFLEVLTLSKFERKPKTKCHHSLYSR